MHAAYSAVHCRSFRLLPQGQSPSSHLVSQTHDQKEDSSQQAVNTGSVTIPPADVYLGNDMAADMQAFFIYQGRCYVQYETLDEDGGLIGEHLGIAKGLIDEWTPEDGYVELAGSIGGDFYAVNGYDPEFILCMKSDGGVRLFICNNGITLQYGSELYEDRLHLSGNIDAVEFESRASWYNSEYERYQISEDSNEIIEAFIRQLDAAEFLPANQIPLEDGVSSVWNMEIYHLYFRMKDGLRVHLRLYQNGYVRFDGIMDAAVQIPDKEWTALLDILENKTGAQKVDVADPAAVQYEKCLSDPELGGFVPRWEPDGMQLIDAYLTYQLDPETGAEIGTRQILIEYIDPQNPEKYYSLTISFSDESENYRWNGPTIDIDQLSDVKINEALSIDSSAFELGARFGNIIVGCWARNIDADTLLQIFESIPNKETHY